MTPVQPVLDMHGVPLPAWMQEHLAATAAGPSSPSASWKRLTARDELPTLAKKLCAACEAEYAVEGDIGGRQGGTPWFCPSCPVPEWAQDQYIREAGDRRHREPLWYRRTRCWYCRGRSFGGPVYAQIAERWTAVPVQETLPELEAA